MLLGSLSGPTTSVTLLPGVTTSFVPAGSTVVTTMATTPSSVTVPGGGLTQGLMSVGAIPVTAPAAVSTPSTVGGESLLVDTMTYPTIEGLYWRRKQAEADGFDHWIEQFEERAGWGAEQKLHQLKLLMENTVLQVLHTLLTTDYKIIDTLRSHFKAVDIEGWNSTIESRRMRALGLELQALGRKAFPSIQGKEFDRLLKGRFFQALHVKWQRKIGAPKPSETFQELYDRARVLERHEQQYIESAASQGKTLEAAPKGVYHLKLVQGEKRRRPPRLRWSQSAFTVNSLGITKVIVLSVDGKLKPLEGVTSLSQVVPPRRVVKGKAVMHHWRLRPVILH